MPTFSRTIHALLRNEPLVRHWIHILFSAAITLFVFSACSKDPADGLSSYKGLRLSERWIEALTEFDDAEFAAFGRGEGAGYLILVAENMTASLERSSVSRFSASMNVLGPLISRANRVLAEEYGFEGRQRIYERFRRLPPDRALEYAREIRRAYGIDRDSTRTPEEKIAAIEEIVSELSSRDAPVVVAHLQLRVAHWEGEAGNVQSQRRKLEACIEFARARGHYRIACQALGVLGALLQASNDEEGMRRCWNEGLELAKKHRLPEQAGRLTSFFATHYESQGRLSLSRELRREATELCEEYGGAPTAVRFLSGWLDFNVRLGCWDVVTRDLRRADQQLERLREWYGPRLQRDRTARIAGIRARVLLEDGEEERAREIFLEAESELGTLRSFAPLARLRERWVRGLLDHGRALQARPVLRRALDSPIGPIVRSGFLVQAARAEAMLGEWEACDVFLSEFEQSQLAREDGAPIDWTLHDVLRLRSARARKDSAAAIAAVQEACRNLDRRLRSMPATQEGNLNLYKVELLHDELHSIVGTRPELGYMLEMQWRRVPGLLGAGSSLDDSPLEACARLATQVLRGESTPGNDPLLMESVAHYAGGTHVVFYVGAESTDRWTRRGGELSRVRVLVSEAELRRRVDRVLRQLDQPPDSGVPGSVGRDLQSELHELAKLLLPRWLLEIAQDEEESPQQFEEVLISLDGPLLALPLGVLNLSATHYLPMVARVDPVYLGHVAERSTPSGSKSAAPGVIMADPIPSPGHLGWQAGLPRLDHGVREARVLHALEPESLLFEREAATKVALLTNWEYAPFLYFASHVVRDPEASYLSYLPLSLPAVGDSPAPRKEDSYLEALDLGTIELKGEPLVVLSSCSSGAPYVTRGAQAPGLGESFLRAGASIVIQNYWSVRDDAAAALMERAVRAWAVDGLAPDHALNLARREMALSADGEFGHPYFWGGAVVTVRRDHQPSK
jgi:CHAT domain-containing protein